ncbi:MAG TPA: HAD family hydrolase [Syntrophales bacterium]|nr:HAD family hydrolase [Syntrophales bacterium]
MESDLDPRDILRGTDAAVFDFDGTLAVLNIDFPAMRGAVRKLAADAGIPPEVLDGLFVLETIEAGRAWLTGKSPDHALSFQREAMSLVTAIEIQAARYGSLIAGVRELLEGMKKREIRRAIITRNCGAAVTLIFPDIADCCDVFLPRDGTERVKPDPGHVLESLSRMGIAPARAVVVGDHPMDIRTGREAGTRTVGVLTGSGKREELLRAGANVIVPSAPDLLQLL